MRVLVTGARGFVGTNLLVHLAEQGGFHVTRFDRGDDLGTLLALVSEADAIIHLAGENRPTDPADFERNNAQLTQQLCKAVIAANRSIPVFLASSIQAENDGLYGRTKRQAEDAVKALAGRMRSPARICRLPNIFGKWSRPNYNSAVATFCHNIARGLPITINDPDAIIRLLYIDDLCTAIIAFLESPGNGISEGPVEPEYQIAVGALADQLNAFRDSRASLMIERVGEGLTRALYSTYVSFLPVEEFAYPVQQYGDPRGVFVEMLKTPDCGQFSYFTAHPGVTRGGHYHHSKTEKFLVIKGRARFGFRHIVTNEQHEIRVSGESPEIVETIPGWSHDITNIGDDDMIVMLWANEIFDRQRPDTITSRV
jgi:UDP-2-acetamido-2,6-beta-L-arabino-hexul-4-ose reductase